MDFENLDADSCYRAVNARDARFDGLFFTAVKTTGVYAACMRSANAPPQLVRFLSHRRGS
jgi:AraC family transcriptional regulator of adaptative response / DNA-3-methyladenine glycosylase II